MRSRDKSDALVKNARNARLHYIKHRRLRKRCKVSALFRDISLTNAHERVMELTRLRYKAFVLTLGVTIVVAACKRGATRETRCRDKSMASPYNCVSGICMCLLSHNSC